jgi:hypothetical protein
LVKKHKPFLLATSKEAFFMTYKLKISDLDLNCLILTRNKKDSSKPKQYLLDLTSKTYISSLFPVPEQPDLYQVDFKALGKDLYAIVKINSFKKTIDVLQQKTGLFVASDFDALLDNNKGMVIKSITSNHTSSKVKNL